MCGESLMPSQDLRTLTVNITQKAIIIVQPQDLVSFETFQNLLAVVWFVHNPTPPSGSYTSVVSVVAFDGQFYSQPANTTITVKLIPSNIVPILEEVISQYNYYVDLFHVILSRVVLPMLVLLLKMVILRF